VYQVMRSSTTSAGAWGASVTTGAAVAAGSAVGVGAGAQYASARLAMINIVTTNQCFLTDIEILLLNQIKSSQCEHFL
jgi:hypothetical protein